MANKILLLEVDGAGASFTPNHTLEQIIVSAETDVLGRSYRRAVLNPTGAILLTGLKRKKGLDVYVDNITADDGTVIIPSGYYTLDPNHALSDVASTTCPIIVGDTVAVGTYTASGASLTGSAYMRIETFYKWATGIPDFMTRDDLYDYGTRADYEPYGWYAPIIQSFSDTIGQELKVDGGLASADGFNLEMNFPVGKASTPNNVKYFHTTWQSTELDLPNFTQDNLIDADGGVQFRKEYLSPFVQSAVETYFGALLKSESIVIPGDDEVFATPMAGFSGSYGDAYPVNNTLNDEAVIVRKTVAQSFQAGTVTFDTVYTNRGVLNTPKVQQSQGTLLYHNHKAIGSTCRVYTMEVDCRGRVDWELLYQGVIDDVNFNNMNSTFSVSISNPILEIYRNTVTNLFGSKIDTFVPRVGSGLAGNEIAPYAARYTDPYNVTAYQVGISQPNKFDRWKWIKVGKAAIRLQSDESILYQTLLMQYEDGSIDEQTYRIIFDQIGSTDVNDLGYGLPDNEDNKAFNFIYSIPRFKNTSIENVESLVRPFSPNMVVIEPFDYDDAGDQDAVDVRNYYSVKGEDGENSSGGVTSGKNEYNTSETYVFVHLTDGTSEYINDYRINRLGPGKQPDLFANAELMHLFEMQEPNFASSENYLTQDGIEGNIFEQLGQKGTFVASHALEVILQILMSTGTGTNTLTVGSTTYNFDVLPSELGLAIPAEYIDGSSFVTLRNEDLSGISNTAIASTYFMLNLYIKQGDFGKLSEWLEKNVLKPFYLSLVQTKDGKIRAKRSIGSSSWANFTDISQIGLTALDIDALGKNGNFSSRLAVSTSNLYSQIGYDVKPFGVPTQYVSQFPKVNASYNTNLGDNPSMYYDGVEVPMASGYTNINRGGSVNVWNRVNRRALKFEPTWYPVFANVAENNFTFGCTRPSGVFLLLYNRPINELTIQCLESEVSGIDIGDFILLDNLNAPDIRGRFRTDVNQYIGYVINRVYDIKHEMTTLKILYFATNIFFAKVRRRIGSSATIMAVTSNVQFTVSPNDYTLDSPTLDTQGIIINRKDYEGFIANDNIVLLDQFFSVKGQAIGDADAYSSRQINSIVTDEIIIDTAFTDSAGVNVTPIVTDIIILSSYGDQTNQQTIDTWLYQYLTTNVRIGI